MIEVGEYVRTKKGYIAKITEIDNYIWFNEKINKESGMAVYELSKVEFENLVAKHSKNIIDLIEVGDYVNGKEICLIDKEENAVIWGFTYKDEQRIFYLYEKDIKSVVTKEQFKSIEYRLED